MKQRMNIFVLLALIFALSSNLNIYAKAGPVSEQEMKEVYHRVKTPYKYGLVIAPDDNFHKMDCPTVYRKGNKWYMTYLVYDGQGGRDGRGYETWLAESEDLLNWKTLGRILSFQNDTWDSNQRGGYMALQDMNWGGSYGIEKYQGKNWITYIGGNSPGYELGTLQIGLAYTKGDIATAHEWKTFSEPLMSPKDSDAQWFETITQYKSLVYRDENKTLGAPFIMFYNAAGYHPETQAKAERIGIALSKDMLHWERYPGNPVFGNEEGMITGDAHIQKMGDLYVMFYFGAFWKDRPYKAFNTFSCSYDLVNWTNWEGPDLIVPSKDYDNLFAHKSFLVEHQGLVYHFYCAVNKDDQRGIAVATSKPMGRSNIDFPKPEGLKNQNITDLNTDWETNYSASNSTFQGFEHREFSAEGWKKVNLPHNWDDYYAYRNIMHGNLHGHTWYRKNVFIENPGPYKRQFLHFEGLGTYAHIYVNGQHLGRYASGRTVLTVDVTSALKPGEHNLIALRVSNRAYDVNMPWICGGCSAESEFSEGSEPLGIFRPVSLEITEAVRPEPFGVHVWNDENTNSEQAIVYVNTELKNYSSVEQNFELITRCNNSLGGRVFQQIQTLTLAPDETRIVSISDTIKNPALWSLENPELYQIQTTLRRRSEQSHTHDEASYSFNHVTRTPFGLRTISFPLTREDKDPRFYLNEQPVFINGITEYENMPGSSSAFTHEQIRSRVKQIKNAGFNAFRDAHDPHNLLYSQLWDENGILFWPGFSSHIWYDTPLFRENFKNLLIQWVKERRNSPSVIMWNLQNESVLPLSFAEECVEIIKNLDPTAGKQRPITISNGAYEKEVINNQERGVDWNVAKNWSGTYRRSLENYAEELCRKEELLNAEYGAWRKLDEHSEGEFQEFGKYSEERMAQLLEMKVRMAESVRDSVCGHFLWLFASHENPGRLSMFKTKRSVDWVGPINYKGIVTIWEEPTDAYYMYKANYVPAYQDPVVYIASHTWNGRWTETGIKDGLGVYSNCEEVELFNDMLSYSLGRKKRTGGIGTHFNWDAVDLRYNVLRAVGYIDNKVVAEDIVILDHLPQAPGFDRLYEYDIKSPLLKGAKEWHYLYRVNCGGDNYTDVHDQLWLADIHVKQKDQGTHWGSKSWADNFPSLHPYSMSQRRTKDPIKGTQDWPLFGNFRFGSHQLQYQFPVPDGEYMVELYFIEPWHGTGSPQADCEGLRIFDVSVNDQLIVDDLDIWAQVGHDAAYKISRQVEVSGGMLRISFPEVKAGQAVISAIAIAARNKKTRPADSAPKLIGDIKASKNLRLTHRSWLDLDENFIELPFATYLGEWLDYDAKNGNFHLAFELNDTAEVYVGISNLFSGQFLAQGFTKVPDEIFKKADGTILYVYKKIAMPSEQIQIDKSKSDADFVVAVCPFLQSHKQDVNYRPLMRYEAETALVEGTFENVQLGKMEALRFFGKKPSLIQWNVEFSSLTEFEYQNRILRICYQNLSTMDKPARLNVATSEGKVLFEQEVILSKTTGKWALSNITLPIQLTGNFIIQLSSSDMKNVAIDALEVL